MSAAPIVLTGAYGHGNLGDDLLATVSARALRREGWDVLVAAGGQGRLSADLTQHRSRLWRRMGRDARLVLGGGGLLNDHWGLDYSRYFASLCVMARMRGAGVGAVGLGIEPPSTFAGAQLIRAVAHLAQPLGVRDASSLRIARRLGARRPMLGVDLGWLAAEELGAPLDGTRAWEADDVLMVTIAGETEIAALRRVGLLAAVICRLRSRHPGMRIRLVAMQERSSSVIHDDRALLAQVRRLAALTDAEIVLPGSVEDAVAAARGVRLAVGYRLHGLLLAYLCGAEVVAISRSSKVSETFADAPGATVCAQTSDATAVADAILAARASATTPESRRRHVAERCAQARATLRTAAAA